MPNDEIDNVGIPFGEPMRPRDFIPPWERPIVAPRPDMAEAPRRAVPKPRRIIDWEAGPVVEKPVEYVQVKAEKKEMFNTTVAELFGIRSSKGMFGVEIEVEGKNLPPEVVYFNAKRDGSLRGEGMEYVFEKPYSLKGSISALGYLEEALKNAKVDMSYRTSVHVHVNVSSMNKMQLCTFLYLAYLFENALVHHAGPSRIGNRFCLRVQDATEKVFELEQCFQRNGFRVNDPNRGKYSAINLACLPTFGSVEFRSMRGTVNKKEITTWLYILNSIIEAAKQYATPKDAAEAFLKLGPREFTKHVFGEYMADIDYEGLEAEMHLAFSLLISLPYEEIKDFI